MQRLTLLAFATQVPALNLSSVARESPTKSPSRALQPAEYDSNSSALVFKQPKKVSILSAVSVCVPVQLSCSCLL